MYFDAEISVIVCKAVLDLKIAMTLTYSVTMLWSIRRLLPCRRPRIELKDLHLLKPFSGNKGRFKSSESYLNNIPVRITTRSIYRPSLLPPQHNSNIKLPIVISVKVNKHMAQHNSNIKLLIVNSANVNKHMAQRNLTDVKKVISPPLLKCSLVKCRFVKKKKSPSSILNLIMEEQLDCLALTKTWLSIKDDINRPFLSRFVPDNWAILHVPRKSRGGDVGFMYSLKFSAKLDTSPSFSSFECQTVLLTAASVTFSFIVIYRVPPTKKNKILKSSFINELGDLLETTSTLSGKLVLLGDFNVHLDKSSEPEAIQLRSLLDSFGMEQHVDGPTHIRGHTLDLVITPQTI